MFLVFDEFLFELRVRSHIPLTGDISFWYRFEKNSVYMIKLRVNWKIGTCLRRIRLLLDRTIVTVRIYKQYCPLIFGPVCLRTSGMDHEKGDGGGGRVEYF